MGAPFQDAFFLSMSPGEWGRAFARPGFPYNNLMSRLGAGFLAVFGGGWKMQAPPIAGAPAKLNPKKPNEDFQTGTL